MSEEPMQVHVANLLAKELGLIPIAAHIDFIETLTYMAIALLRGQYDEDTMRGFLDSAQRDRTAIHLEYVTQKH